ncbi:hypothetical protein SB6095_04577 [Klebsiella quasivariicola]|nr:Uncharacterised protein [Klebsiella quasivariicola]VGQ13481.1 hypothetical protein SB6095_04577 [Klebsiella quasivariicola]
MMVQTKAPVPGSALLPIVHETAGFVAQGMQSRQLIVRNRGVRYQVAGFSRYRSNLVVIESEGEQQSRRPQAEDGHQTTRQSPFPRHSHVMPA